MRIDLQNDTRISVELLDEKARQVICYPQYTLAGVEQRICELKRLGIKYLEFTGKNHINGVHVLGKGCVGIVIAAERNGKQAALKIRRTDASRSTMHHEASMLTRANAIGIGPRLIGDTRNCLIMEYVPGVLIPEWLMMQHQRSEVARVQQVLRSIMEQVWRLDQIGLDHGELSNGSKHLLVKPNDVPVILDFESGSISRRPANVTSISQYLFVGSSIAQLVGKILGCVQRDYLIDALKMYKRSRVRADFIEVTRRCRL